MGTRQQPRTNIHGQRVKWCSFGKHWEVADTEYFHANYCYNDGLSPDCRECRKLRNRGAKPAKLLSTNRR